MESIYYVLCWHCHRRCKHCYEDRFHPYVRDELWQVVSEARTNAPKIIANLPDSMQFKDTGLSTQTPQWRTGRIIISGGDVLTEPVRESVLYPALDAIRKKYENNGGVKVIVQTTGDLLTEKILAELLDRGVWSVSAAGMDDYHTGMQDGRRDSLITHLRKMFEKAGMISMAEHTQRRLSDADSTPVYTLFGATEDSWIGKLWPRGRAWRNGLSKATMDDNFCNAWSGGRGFLEMGNSGSEVSIDPDGNVYPCCIKTAAPLGNLTEEPLQDILASVADLPAMQAINQGQPEQMGIADDWSETDYLNACHTKTPTGEDYANLCIGCDTFHENVLGPRLNLLREQRRARRLGVIASSAG